MVKEEIFYIDGEEHVRHYSDSGMMIASEDGAEYETAEDFAYLGKVYHETDTPVPDEEVGAEEALDIILGRRL